MKIKAWIAAIILIVTNLLSYTQEDRTVSFVFYNVENLFDTDDDPVISDEEFTPDGEKKWNATKYYSKLDNIARVLTGIGEWQLPEVVGLCEIENKKVLTELAGHRLLKEQGYKIIHKDSPDRRGIDVALLYDEDVFQPLSSSWIGIRFPDDPDLRTRDILYVTGQVYKLDTIHIFINHWPSRWGGVAASMPKRVFVASVLRSVTDSIFEVDKNPNIIIAGDLNDNPADSSIMNVLLSSEMKSDSLEMLENLMDPVYKDWNTGTLKYKGNWDVFDQIIVSVACKELEHSRLVLNGPFIYNPGYLLEEDDRYLGEKPFRTYAGPRYLGGFSDHLPVYIRFQPYELIEGVKYIDGESK